jgi:SpoVK/Ycf46/Vps4 family AAA+-type ATPase
MFFKALCNALKRDAYIIDMREIRTGSDFAKIFRDGNSEKYKKYVYILDEFDCVQGVIKNRSLDGTVDNTDNQLAELRDRMIKIMGLLAKMQSNKSKDSKDANEPNSLEEELRSIRKQIQELQNKLTLDTMLTILDGTDEHRGRVIVAATNYVANIDKALVRNGRFDEVIELGAFDENEMREMLHKMYDKTETTEELQKINTTRLKANTFTPTDLIKLASRYNTLSNVLTVIADDTKSLASEVLEVQKEVKEVISKVEIEVLEEKVVEEKVEIEVLEEKVVEEKVVEEKVVEDTTTSITVIQQNSADSFRQDNLHGSESKQHKKTKKNRKR